MHESSAEPHYLKRHGAYPNMRHLIVEGWRFIPHSYAIVNQFQCLEMLKHKDLMLYHRDLPFFNPNWTPVRGLFNEDAESKLRTIPNPPEDLNGDVQFRIGYPYDFRASRSAKTFVFGTSEFGVIYDKMLFENVPLREVLKDSDVRIIVPSNWSKQGFVRSGAEPERITVIPHGVDTDVFKSLNQFGRAELREKRGWQKSFVFLNIGAMTDNKGIVILLKSFAEVATYYSNSKLVLKGMDSLYTSKEFLTDIKRHLSGSELDIIAPRMEYIGGTSSFADIASLYQAADCYVSPYLAEGFNMPVLEAAACGLPVICTEGGSTDDFVTEEFALRIRSELKEHRENGRISRVLLIPDGGHLITLMRKAIEDSVWKDNACLSGPVFIKKKFTWEDVTRQLLNTFFKPDQELAHSHQKWVSVRQEKLESEGNTMVKYDRSERREQGGSGKSPDELYEEAQKLINSGSKEEAIGVLEMFLAMHPNYAVAHNDLGVLYYSAGEKKKALDHYEQAAQRDMGNATIQKNLADFYCVEQGRLEEALQIYVKLLETNPTDLETLLTLGKICETLKMINDAKVFYSKVLELEPWNMDARKGLDELGKGQKSEVAPVEHPEGSRYNWSGRSEAGSHESGIRKEEVRGTDFRDTPDKMYQDVQELLNSNRKMDAVDALEKLVASYPDYALAHNDLGVLYFSEGDKEKSLQHYEKAAALEPRNSVFQKNLADFYYVISGRTEEALEIYLKMLEANPTDMETLLIMGHICVSLRNFDDAKVFYSRVLEIEPWNVDAREKLDQLGKGQRSEVRGRAPGPSPKEPVAEEKVEANKDLDISNDAYKEKIRAHSYNSWQKDSVISWEIS